MFTFLLASLLILLPSSRAKGLALANGCQHPCQTEGLCQTKKFDDKCYYIFTNGEKTWSESKELCVSNNMTLVKLDPQVLQDQFNLKDLTERGVIGSKVWLGGRVEEMQEWTFLNGVPQSRTRSGNISAFGVGEDVYQCAMIQSNATVMKTDCRNKFPFICRFDDWRGNPIYQITDVATTWFEARSFCTSRGADLFFLKENENILFLKNKLAAFQNQMLFIGLTHRTWRWEDGDEVKYYNWLDTEPNSISEKCMAMYSSEGLWIDMDCNATMNAFCQKVVSCDRPNAPANGRVMANNHSVDYQSVVNYSCNTGYNLIGDGQRTCQKDGSLSGHQPSCQKQAGDNNITVTVESPQSPFIWIPHGVILLVMGLVILGLIIGLIVIGCKQRSSSQYDVTLPPDRDAVGVALPTENIQTQAKENMEVEMASLKAKFSSLENILAKIQEESRNRMDANKKMDVEMASLKAKFSSLEHILAKFEDLEKNVKSLSMQSLSQRNESSPATE